uniref:leukocyte immunoglobulin-like receptor subfamily A member 5 isoform X2 n=1 Tax=Myodes glareolus TaxID=447135 RepID=UPI0020226DAD|nr:leukocyte immunoglobulin-like receptor subfamily A member 5 isoform X2 [Myodes glareolus]
MVLGTTLLGLGPPPKTSIWAVPGSVISIGSDVTVFCRTPPGVTHVRLTHYVLNGKWFDRAPQGVQEVFEFSLQNMTHTSAGTYHCDYTKEGEWSQNSDHLELVVTGVYKIKPSLTIDSRPKGSSERKMTLLCHTHHSFDIFILCRGGNASLPRNCSHQDHNTFLISPVSPGHKRMYICFGSYKRNSYLWSLPSDPLVLSTTESSTSDYRLENCIRLFMAVILLLGLGALLLDAWKSRKEPMGPLESPKLKA